MASNWKLRSTVAVQASSFALRKNRLSWHLGSDEQQPGESDTCPRPRGGLVGETRNDYWGSIGDGRPGVSLGSMSLGEAPGDDGVRRRIKRHSDVRARNFKIGLRIPGHAIPPIYDAVVARVNCGLEHGVRNIALQQINKIAGATPSVAGWQYATAMLRRIRRR